MRPARSAPAAVAARRPALVATLAGWLLCAAPAAGLADPLEVGPPWEPPPGRIELELALGRAETDEDHENAARLAAEWLAALEAEADPEAPGLVEALTRVGRNQRLAGEHAEAEATLLRAIALAHEEDGRLSERQLAPMTELGFTYQGMDEHPLAIATFTEAQGLSRRLLGLMNLDQVAMLDGMAWSLLALEALAEAEERQLEAFRIAERHHGPDSLELLSSLYRLGLWQRRTGKLGEERMLYMRALRLLEADGGENDLRLIDPLRRLAKSMQYAASFMDPRSMPAMPTGHPSADQALARALAIVRAQDPPRPDLEALLLIDQGDWLMALARRNTALERYAEAWQVLADAEDGEALRERWLSRPVAVTSPQPSWLGVRPRGSEPGLEDGQVVATFTVNAMGQAENVQIIESHPPGRKDTTVRRTLRSMRFRPRFEDGEPVASEDQRYSFLYGFRP